MLFGRHAKSHLAANAFESLKRLGCLLWEPTSSAYANRSAKQHLESVQSLVGETISIYGPEAVKVVSGTQAGSHGPGLPQRGDERSSLAGGSHGHPGKG